ncbi:MAG TPA: hemerythrin domain-containing protein [Dehalococcoidia bacterium]|nr:hemerythrin domain-containing protein [Dehalococcoidia bacterium]
MSEVTDAIRRHHQVLMTELEEASGALSTSVGEPELDRLISLLTQDLLPHARGEERSFYPLVDPLVAAHARPTATMSIDHEFIEAGVRDLERLAAAARTQAGTERGETDLELRRRLLELVALVRVHVEKEERVYLPLIEAHLAPDEQQTLLDEMHSE